MTQQLNGYTPNLEYVFSDLNLQTWVWRDGGHRDRAGVFAQKDSSAVIVRTANTKAQITPPAHR